MTQGSYSLKDKIRLMLAGMVLLPLLVTGFFSYRLIMTSIDKNARIFTEQLGRQILLNTDNYIEEVKKLTVYLFSSDLIMDFLVENKAGQIQRSLTLTERSELSLALSSPFYYGSEVRGVYLFSNNGYLIGTNVNKDYKGETEPFFWRNYESGNHLLPYHRAEYYSEKAPVFSVVRQVNQLYTSEPIGFIKVDLMPNTFEKILGQVSLTPHTSITITDSQGNLFYSHNTNDPLEKESDSILSSEESAKSDLIITTIIPLDDLDDEAAILVRTYIFLSLFLLLILIATDRLFSRIITTPVERIKEGMRAVQEENYAVRLEVIRKDELGDISSSFNNMVADLGNSIDRIKNLNREMYETKLHEHELELRVLRKQINPHFLYNTLELVNMIALEKDFYEISDLVTALGDLFRYTTQNDIDYVPLMDEIEFIRAYTQIVSVRSSGKIRFHFDIPHDSEGLIIPKLTIQPLVENAVKHGLVDSEGIVSVWSRLEGDDLLITVKDDGVGVPAENSRKSGYALHNINQRILLQFGEPYGLTLDKEYREGASFTIRLPRLTHIPEREV